MRYKYIVLIFLLLMSIQCVSAADSQGVPKARWIYEDPWQLTISDPGITSPVHLATASGYFQSASYTESEWTAYWNDVCDDYNYMNIDAVVIMPGLKYFASKRGDIAKSSSSYDERVDFYGGDGWFNWTIDTAHAHDIDVIMWIQINKYSTNDYLTPIDSSANKVKYRLTPTSTSLYQPTSGFFHRFDYNSAAVRNHYTSLAGYAMSVSPDVDGVQWEELGMYYVQSGETIPSYGDASVQAYIDAHGVSPLSTDETSTVLWNMKKVNEYGLNTYMSELRTVVLDNTSKTYPDILVGATSLLDRYSDTTLKYQVNITHFSKEGYLDYYGFQRASLSTSYAETAQGYLNSYTPEMATWCNLYPTNFQQNTDAQIAYAPYVYDNILQIRSFGAHAELMFRHGATPLSYEGVVLRDFLHDNLPPDPSYNQSQEQEGSPITNPDVTFSNLIKKTSPDNTFTTFYDDIDYINAGSNAADTAYRNYEHDEIEIPAGVTSGIRTYTKMGNRTEMTGSMIIELYNASNTTGHELWSMNHTTWNNDTNTSQWGAAGGDWYDLNDDLRGSVPICSFVTNATDPIGTKYDCDITTLVQNATNGINLMMKSPNESTAYKHTWFYGCNAVNSSNRPLMTFAPMGESAPNITTKWNNETGNDNLSIDFQLPGYIKFGATANQTVDQWYWSVDDVLKSEASANYTSELFTSGNHTVAVYCENNSIVSGTITWIVNVTGMVSYQPGTPENSTTNTGIGYINVSWDTNKTNDNVVDDYLIVDQDTEQPFYTDNLYYNFTGLLGQEYNFTLYAVNNTNTTTSSVGDNFQVYPSVNTTNEWYNHTSSAGKTVTIYVRAVNTTHSTYSDWVEQTVELPDNTNPTYSSVSHNTTIVGESVLFSIEYNDTTSLHPNGQYIFSTNNTGTWINTSLTNFTSTPETITNTTILNSTSDTIVGYRWYVDDNAGNVNNTPIYTLTTTENIWLSGYAYRMPIEINNTGDNLTYYQYNFTVDTLSLVSDGKMNADGSDCRITDNNTVLQPFWNETAFNLSNTKIWVNATELGNITNTTHYMYYGKSDASVGSSGDDTFLFFDNFTDGTYEAESGIISNFGDWSRNRASYIVGDFAYVTENTGMHVINISDINNPVEVGNITLGTSTSQVLDIEVRGNYAYIAVLGDDELEIVNISNHSNLVAVGNVTDATKLDQIHGINVSGNYVYCCAYAGGTGGYLTLVNVSDPTNPVIEGSITSDANNYIKGSHDVQVIGDYAYLAASNHNVDNDGRVTIINISNKSNPTVVSSLTGSELHRIADIQVKGDYAFVGQFGYGDPVENRYFRVINISNVSNPVLEGGLAGYNMYIGYIHGDLIYCADNRHDYITVINISTPTSPAFVKQYTIPNSKSLAVLHVFVTGDGNHAVVARYDDPPDTKPYYIIDTQVKITYPWIITESVSGDVVSASDKHLNLSKGGSDGALYIKHSIPSCNDIIVEFNWSSKGSGNGPSFWLADGDEVGDRGPNLFMNLGTNKLRYYAGAYYDIATISADTWYHIKITSHTGTDKFDVNVYYENGTEISYSNANTDLNFRNSLTYIDRIFTAGYSGNVDVVLSDTYFVRKYASIVPLYTLGDEEQNEYSILNIINSTNINTDWGQQFNSNISANVTVANASNVYMNFTHTDFTNSSLGDLNLTLNEWVNESHNVDSPITNISITITLHSSTAGASNDTETFWYEITKRTNTATMDSSATQTADTSETFYVNATCNEEYSDTFYGGANLLEDGVIVDTDNSVTDYVNFSHSEGSAGQYNYTVRFFNTTHYDNATSPTYSNVTISGVDPNYEPPLPISFTYTTGNFWVNYTWAAGSGNVTDSYNVSQNGTWVNGSSTTFNNSSVGPHGTSTINLYAYNSSGTGTLLSTFRSNSVTVPNNVINISNILSSYSIDEGDTLNINADYTDIDGDTPTFTDNSSEWNVNSGTGIVSWTTVNGDNGVHSWYIKVDDGYGSTDQYNFTVTVNDTLFTAPIIDEYNNSISDTNMYPVVSSSGSVTFYASADQSITTWTWYVDGVDQSNNVSSFTTSWPNLGYKSVEVTAENVAGVSNMVEWNPYVKMAMAGAGDTVTDMDEAGYDNLIGGLGGDNPDFELVMVAFTEPYIAVIGNMFFVILFGIPMIMFWIRQGSLIIPSVFGIVLGTLLLSFFPSSFAATASAIIVLSILATFYTFYKEKR